MFIFRIMVCVDRTDKPANNNLLFSFYPKDWVFYNSRLIFSGENRSDTH